MSGRPELHVEAPRVRAGRLALRYRVTNPSERPRYAFDLLSDGFGQLGAASERPRRGLAQLVELAPGRVLALLGVVGRADADPRITYAVAPYAHATKIAPGREHAAELALPLPLCEWNLWHRPRRDAGLERARVDTLVLALELGSADGPQQPEPQRDRIGWFEHAYRIRHDAPFERVAVEVDLGGLGVELLRDPTMPR